MKAARAILDWKHEALSHVSGVTLFALRRIENGHLDHPLTGSEEIKHKLISALERAGVVFIPPENGLAEGVRLRIGPTEVIGASPVGRKVVTKRKPRRGATT